jgi:hypothetical protein
VDGREVIFLLVIPAEAGIQLLLQDAEKRDPSFRWNDGIEEQTGLSK